MLAATAAELAGAVVTAAAAREGRVEPLRSIAAPLDVLCQQLIGMACGGEWSVDDAFALVRRPGRWRDLTRDRLRRLPRLPRRRPRRAPRGRSSPSRARRPAGPRRGSGGSAGCFGVRTARVAPLVLGERRDDHLGGVGPRPGRRGRGRHARRGVRRAAAGRRPLRARRPGAGVPPARGPDRPREGSGGEPNLPALVERPPVALGRAGPRPRPVPRRGGLASRSTARRRFAAGSCESHDLDPEAAAVLEDLFEAQEQFSEIPRPRDAARRGIAAGTTATPTPSTPP